MQEGATAQSDANGAQGEQPANKGAQTGGQVSSDALDAKRKAWRELVSGEYKDIYTEETQRMVDRRFRETKALQERVDANQPIIDLLMQRYGVTDGDTKTLAEKLENDTAYWRASAAEAGMSAEQYKEFQKLKRDNAALLAEQRRRLGQQQMDAKLQQWYSEGEALKAKFPNFDLEAEARNPQFTSMLRSGVPVEQAYKVMHWDEIFSDTVQVTAAAAEKRVADSVRAKGARPAENGTASQSGFVVKDDVHKLSKKDRAEIVRRAMGGEKITF